MSDAVVLALKRGQVGKRPLKPANPDIDLTTRELFKPVGVTQQSLRQPHAADAPCPTEVVTPQDEF